MKIDGYLLKFWNPLLISASDEASDLKNKMTVHCSLFMGIVRCGGGVPWW